MLKYHIQTVEISSTQNNILLTGIPQTYNDLVVVVSGRTTRTGNNVSTPTLNINSDPANHSSRILYTDPSTGSFAISNLSYIHGSYIPTASATANTFGSTSFHIPNYTLSTTKTVSVDGVAENNGQSVTAIVSGLWTGTSPVTSVTVGVVPGEGDFVAGSTISIYGIRRGSDGVTSRSPAAQGGAITTSGGYTIHTFTSSGTFFAQRSLEAEYLVVAGGGGGGRGRAGGGGAGGYLAGQFSAVASQGYQVVVGAGGPGAVNNQFRADSGQDSLISGLTATNSIFSVTSIGGGGGGSNGGVSDASFGGGPGGSGGGSAIWTTTVGLGTAGQGNNGGGGTAAWPTFPVTTGGGGAGAAGQARFNTTKHTDGGVGLSSSITGSAVFRAGGGGGGGDTGTTRGEGGNGGGAPGGISAIGGNGTAATGGGGGGGGRNAGTGEEFNGGNGGSGVVIIRYLTP